MTPKSESKNKFKARLFKALSDPVRLDILEFLHDGEKCVCEIVPHVNLIQPVVSRHLKILKDCGMIDYRKDGTRRLYSITNPQVFQIIDCISPDFVEACTKRSLRIL